MSDTATTANEPPTEAANILLVVSPFDHQPGRPCAGIVDGETGPPTRSLWITYTQSATEKLALLNQTNAVLPAKTGIVVVGARTRSTAPSGGEVTTQPASPVIRTVVDPKDLTGLSIELSRFFEAWGGDDGQLSLCFDSITTLLVYANVDRGCRFLSALTSRVDAIDATAHYHLDPDAHRSQTVRRLSSLFDAVVEWN